MTPVQELIYKKLQDSLNTSYLEVINESYKHGGTEKTESHFQLIIVSEAFRQKSLVKRHRDIYKCLSQELAGTVHALAIACFTPEEWAEESEKNRTSPPCANKHS